MEISIADPRDSEAIHKLDAHLSLDALVQKLQQSEVLVARVQGDIVGCLRFGWFWDELPFINLLWVQEPFRRQGVGRALVLDWEARMRGQGHTLALTSTLANEPGQHFWRALGYEDCGALLLPGEATELFLRKAL